MHLDHRAGARCVAIVSQLTYPSMACGREMPDGTAALKNLLRNEVARLRPPGSSYDHAMVDDTARDVDDVYLHAAAGLGGGRTNSTRGKRAERVKRTSSVEEVGFASIFFLLAAPLRKLHPSANSWRKCITCPAFCVSRTFFHTLSSRTGAYRRNIGCGRRCEEGVKGRISQEGCQRGEG